MNSHPSTKIISCLVFCLFFVTLAGCGKKPESLVKTQVKLMNELADAIEDGNSDKADALSSKLERTSEQLNAMDVPEEEKNALIKKYQSEMEEALKRLLAASMKSETGVDIGSLLGN